MNERLLDRGAGRVFKLDETPPPSSHIKNYWTPLHTFAGKILRNNKPQHVFSGTAEPRGATERPGSEHEKVSINIDFVPPPRANNKSNISGGSRVGHQLTDFEMVHHKGKPHKKSPSMDGNVPKCPLEFEGVSEC